jgi:hypothetical protein
MEINGDRAGPFRKSVEHLEGMGRESVVVILRFLCGAPPPVSVKDRGVDTRE